MLKAHEKLAAEIAKRGWGVKDAALALDCAPSYISDLRNGVVTPSLALAARIEDTLGIPCRLWAKEKPADQARNRPGSVGKRQGQNQKGRKSSAPAASK